VRKVIALIVLALSGCATSGPPFVDMTDVDPVVYQRDLDHCEAIGNSSDMYGPLVAGAIMGATIGAGVGTLFVAPVGYMSSATVAEAYGSGAVAGAAGEAAANAPSSQKSDSAERPTIAQCLSAKGYKVIGGGA
jgi:hypothetical protein